jgi:hypothetical protein
MIQQGQVDGSTSGSSDASTGGRHRRRPESIRSVVSTTCGTRMPPSPSALACRCSRSPASWARASPYRRHYGQLANDSREHAVALPDALAFERAVDAAWTSPRPPRKPVRKTASDS